METIKPAKKYRYVSDSLSRNMLKAVERHISKIGCPLEVRATSDGPHGGWYQLEVIGMLGKLVLRGCSWGYGGEGPHATRDVLMKLGLSKVEADFYSFRQSNRGVGMPECKGDVYWIATLLPVVPSGTAYHIEAGKVIIDNTVNLATA